MNISALRTLLPGSAPASPDSGSGADRGWVVGGGLAGAASGALAGYAWSRQAIDRLPVNSQTVREQPVTGCVLSQALAH